MSDQEKAANNEAPDTVSGEHQADTEQNDKAQQNQQDSEAEAGQDTSETEQATAQDSAADETAVEQPAAEVVEKALADAEAFRDKALRAEAEMQNIKRRAERDVENAHKFGVERFLQNLLPVVDSIEKAIEASEAAETAEDDPVFEGIKLCHKLLVDVLGRESVETIDPHGEPFNPNEHEALSMIENPEVEPNSVVVVVQKGYKLNGRLVRPAMVMVSKAPAAAS